ncbi:MFS transporter [Actibacterium pelagium]|uniref:Sugar:cation symporter n=1 Tax=Actibacterium pelagium TaxID=2029103 RepID=A0A917EH31_9RHOB|nr:MFS transporter [Actibacterium pelagium]GGE38710.1 sugar:cation symporter [Actibacterium pelagium]
MSYFRVSLFAAFLAGGGIPLYVHLPLYATDVLGLSLSTLAIVLVVIRLIDTVQDPLLGRLADRFGANRPLLAAVAVLGLSLGFLLLFTLRPDTPTGAWLLAVLVLVFTAYSFATILFYGRGVELASGGGPDRHYRLAGFRETGTLVGILVAVSLPQVGSGAGMDGYAILGLTLAGLGVVMLVANRGLWPPQVKTNEARFKLSDLRDADATPVLILALVNALPVAITSTLFLFFVEDKLQLPDYAGHFLLLFFLCAGLSAPIWSRLSQRFGAKRVLLPAMVLAIVSFIGAASLAPGSAMAFAVISAASGAALGADMVILPALFSVQLERGNVSTGVAFGIWAFVAKLALAMAAGITLPLLDFAGFEPGQTNSAQALTTLTWAYAVVPCILKLCAIWMVVRLPETPLATTK